MILSFMIYVDIGVCVFRLPGTCDMLWCTVDCGRLSDREKYLQNAINATYRFDSDVKDFGLWLTKVDVVLSRYADMTSEQAALGVAQRTQIADSLRVSDLGFDIVIVLGW